ncbi:tRNA (adenosine(37)-N6)-threonylcarbamoyltransferase complex ATPase subunit type 1 TsaE [Bartonella sp. HY038]|uniref:tRNA (adenosine(37)-N6)-threonylcarbamoyltransferase complex ATPase subunit type 1 TsaE n=1 Tax=Bartonella sp. HY038 TaxID=2759660 RepID=UPI0015FB70D9|nr:tRNA (adenosine(37)-N6)-threonylcarbamoyltransferase complex ATPase subunit type 1 TsaE [Bartonella sp. HY038]
MELTLHLSNEDATKRFGEDLALTLKKGDLIILEGDLGMGKSTLARSIIQTLADDDTLDVPSPTFTLVQTYNELRLPVAHADLYRIGSPEEIYELGLEQALDNGVLIVEWPDKAEGLLPRPTFSLRIFEENDGRGVIIAVDEEASLRLRRTAIIRDFLIRYNRGEAKRHFLAGDASARAYELITYGEDKCEVLMDAPQLEMPEKTGASYAKTANLAQSIDQFVGIDRIIRENNFNAPEIYAGDLDSGLLLLEYLGQDGIIDERRLPVTERYLAATAFLADFHEVDWPKHAVWEDLSIEIPNYDRDALHIETNLLLDWYLPFISQVEPIDQMREYYYQIWDVLFDELETAPKSLVMRDYHSPNILWCSEREGNDRIGLIDFQDAQMGPTAYDVVSLAQDARITIAAPTEEALIRHYCSKRALLDKQFNEKQFRQSYAILGAQRACKLLGLFIRLDKRDGKPQYLKHLPRMTDYLLRNLKHPALSPLKDFLRMVNIIR